MAYNEQLTNRIRERLAELSNIEEKAMMGGLTFMYNDKMCVGALGDEMMCRIDPGLRPLVLEKTGCREMAFSGRTLKGFVLVDETAIGTNREFDYWIELCLEFNPRAKSSKKKKNK